VGGGGGADAVGHGVVGVVVVVHGAHPVDLGQPHGTWGGRGKQERVMLTRWEATSLTTRCLIVCLFVCLFVKRTVIRHATAFEGQVVGQLLQVVVGNHPAGPASLGL